MQVPIHIYRSSTLYLLGGVVASGLCIGCVLRLYFLWDTVWGVEQVALLVFVLFSGWMAVLLLYELLSPDPVISLLEDRIVLRSVGLRHHVAEIPRECLVYVTTNALSGNETSDLIFTVAADCFDKLRELPAWRTAREGKLYFIFTNAEVSPSRAATMITGWIHGVRPI